MEPAILYVDDERANLDLFQRSFDEEFTVLTAADGPAALALLAAHDVAVLVSDQRMEPMSGIELLTEAAARWPLVIRVLLTAYSDRDLLLQAIQRGRVNDYVLKPWQHDDLALRLKAGLDAFLRKRTQAQAEVERDVLRDQLEAQDPSSLVGLTGGLAPLAAKLVRVAPTDTTVLIRGETGTGKELVARELHRASHRAARPFVRVNCAAFSEGVLESELFGHEAGSFTGAGKARMGRFEQANGGTLFLDEIGDISAGVQVRLLRVLQEREFERVGGNRTVRVDIRVIAATHRDLEGLIRAGQFRQDLFYRLNVVQLDVPPLRSRPEDLTALAQHFLAHFTRQLGKRVSLSQAALASLPLGSWIGNVRELRNVIERAVVLADDGLELEPEDLSYDLAMAAVPQPVGAPPAVPGAPMPQGSVFEEIAQAEAERLKNALRQAGGARAKAARLLGIPRTTLNDRLKKLGIL
jgi:DNA-binding NtrC family response regulator